MFACILLALLTVAAVSVPVHAVELKLTDRSVGYDQKAFDACIDSCSTDGECEACDAIVEAGI